MKTNPRNLFGTVALASVLTLSLAAIGCGSDPDGGSGGGTGGTSGGGSGGTSGGTLGAIVGTPLATFDVSAETFTINNYADAANLGATGSATAAATTAEFTSTEGSPSMGALKISAPFSDWNQNVDIHAAAFPMDMLKDWSGKKLHVRIKVASGFVSDMYALGGAQPYILTGTSYTFGSLWTNIPSGTAWKDYVIDLASVGADPSMVIMFGLQIASGQGNATAAKPTAATIYVDSFSLE